MKIKLQKRIWTHCDPLLHQWDKSLQISSRLGWGKRKRVMVFFYALHTFCHILFTGPSEPYPTGPKGPQGDFWVSWELMGHLNLDPKELNIDRKRKKVMVF